MFLLLLFQSSYFRKKNNNLLELTLYFTTMSPGHFRRGKSTDFAIKLCRPALSSLQYLQFPCKEWLLRWNHQKISCTREIFCTIHIRKISTVNINQKLSKQILENNINYIIL